MKFLFSFQAFSMDCKIEPRNLYPHFLPQGFNIHSVSPRSPLSPAGSDDVFSYDFTPYQPHFPTRGHPYHSDTSLFLPFARELILGQSSLCCNICFVCVSLTTIKWSEVWPTDFRMILQLPSVFCVSVIFKILCDWRSRCS